jgi:hypothetical protein
MFTIEVNAGQDTVELPAFLSHAKDLSCAEIGMIFMIASLVCDQNPGVTMQRMGSDESGAIKSLKEKGILIVSGQDSGKLSMRLDLDVIELMECEEEDEEVPEE